MTGDEMRILGDAIHDANVNNPLRGDHYVHLLRSGRVGFEAIERVCGRVPDDATRASHKAGRAVLMRVPNIVRGLSHSGNVSAPQLAEAGVLDLSSSACVLFSQPQATLALNAAVTQRVV